MLGPMFNATARLSARPIGPDDLDLLLRMHRDPVVMATLGGLKEDSWSQQYLAGNLEHWAKWGYGIWMVFDRATGAYAGRGALRHYLIKGVDEETVEDAVEVGYALMPEYWGRGLATELARELVRIAFADVGLDGLICLTLTTNLKSQRVMQKAGFAYDRDIVHAELPHVLYRQSAEEWRRREENTGSGASVP